MKNVIFSFLTLIGLISCSHQSFEEITYHDMRVYRSTFIISSDIRNDTSGFHRKAYEDALKSMNKIIDENIEINSIEEYLTFTLIEKYPAETTEIIVKNLMIICDDASIGIEEEGKIIFPLLSATTILENALILSKTEPY